MIPYLYFCVSVSILQTYTSVSILYVSILHSFNYACILHKIIFCVWNHFSTNEHVLIQTGGFHLFFACLDLYEKQFNKVMSIRIVIARFPCSLFWLLWYTVIYVLTIIGAIVNRLNPVSNSVFIWSFIWLRLVLIIVWTIMNECIHRTRYLGIN